MTQPSQPAGIGPPTLAASTPTEPPVDSNLTTGDGGPGAAAMAPPSGPRYLLGGELARGGMGVVYRATDSTLVREVAVKVLHERFAPDSGTARRFADEARIMAQLQHPGIPPVHDLGRLPDCRPLLAMKLIKGDTLEQLLHSRSHPSEQRGRLVAVFEAVCQAVAYAHANGVIHRDLKPANVMVGAFGEVQVMDWGLAKVLPSRERERPQDDAQGTIGPTELVTLRDSDALCTQAGSVLGTPAYMPPEQAIGAIDQVDARSDVFGLGSVLAEVLTGRPPFVAESAEATRQLAARGRLQDCFALLDGCGAEPGLLALCKRCLAAEKQNRPADAGEVASAVAALRQEADERARTAELERARAEGERAKAQAEAREQRRRRRVQLGLVAAVATLLLSVGAFAWWQSAWLGRNAEAVSALLDQAEEALRGGDADRAEVALLAAGKRAAEGGASRLAGRMQGLKRDLELLRALDEVDRFRWTPDESKLPEPAVVAARFREVLERFGMGPDAGGPDEAAARADGSAVRQRVVAALDRVLRQQKSAAVRATLRRLDAAAYRDAVRDAVLAGNAAKLAELANRPEALEQPAEFAAFLGEDHVVLLARRRRLLETAVAVRPGELGVLMALAGTYPVNQWEGSEQRLRWCQAAVAAAPGNAAAHNNLGNVLRDRKDVSGAEVAFRSAIRLEPRYALAHNGLGLVLYDRKKLSGAEAEYREAIRLDPKLAWAHINLGIVLRASKDLRGAEARYREALRLDPKFANAHNNLGWVLEQKGDLDGAVGAFTRALQIEPKHPAAQMNLPNAERMRQLLPRLPVVLAGKEAAKTPAEACDFARLCRQPFQKRFASAARLCDGAFAADPKLASDLTAAHRYHAAASAARAGRGDGVDAPADPAERAALRGKALAWLKADLALRHK
jgi:tetratricopeptide (TPR) repeat protein